MPPSRIAALQPKWALYNSVIYTLNLIRGLENANDKTVSVNQLSKSSGSFYRARMLPIFDVAKTIIL
ncbi:hypothetical protein NTGM5_790004 [Candidatus Nitrotoga sp. M5]|nr:hypothetical protein NTGM5_790004 [Candidatus Nitrotoga sp. M5]